MKLSPKQLRCIDRLDRYIERSSRLQQFKTKKLEGHYKVYIDNAGFYVQYAAGETFSAEEAFFRRTDRGFILGLNQIDNPERYVLLMIAWQSESIDIASMIHDFQSGIPTSWFDLYQEDEFVCDAVRRSLKLPLWTKEQSAMLEQTVEGR